MIKRINGYIKDGKYNWNQAKKLPNYYNESEALLTISKTVTNPGVHKFYMGDSEQFYLKNLNEMPDDWHYRKKDVTYTLNSLGYRAKELNEYDWSESIVLLGCSIAFGVGVSDDETIAHYLHEITGRDVINLGVPGGSNQLMLDYSVRLKKKYGNPYGLIMLWSTMDRCVYYGDDRWQNIGRWNSIIPPNNLDYKLEQLQLLYNNLYVDIFNEYIPFYHIAETSRMIWETTNTRYTELSYFEPTSHYGQLPDCIRFECNARDKLHPGAEYLKIGAETLVNQLVEKYGNGIYKK